MTLRPKLPWLSPDRIAFPDPRDAWQAPDGLLAAGGALTVPWLLAAYRGGIFPWFDDDAGPLLWWSPDPRAGLHPASMHVPKRLGRSIRSAYKIGRYRASADAAFAEVVSACAGPRRDGSGTWITPAMQQAYQALHASGHAHSIEIWESDALIGGIYGVAVGTVFCGESMFSHRPGSSKLAFYTLCRHLAQQGFTLLDAQMPTSHLASLGVTPISRERYLQIVAGRAQHDHCLGRWQLAPDHARIAPSEQQSPTGTGNE
ncbi:MAG: leucyl/phenylalanyl-tRNA--protein transferase [Pseudomonadales bacterium]